jgi:hypothetical protein
VQGGYAPPMPRSTTRPGPIRLRRILAGVLLSIGSVSIGACADDTSPDEPAIDEDEGGVGGGEQNVPLPPDPDAGEDDDPRGELDGERPGLGGDPGGPGVDEDGDIAEQDD